MLVPEMLPGPSFPPSLLQQLDRSADRLLKMILAFFPLWLLLLLPEPSWALLGGTRVILFRESGQYGPPVSVVPSSWALDQLTSTYLLPV